MIRTFFYPSSLLLHAGSPIRVHTALAGPRGSSSQQVSTPSPSRPLLSLLATSAFILCFSIWHKHSSFVWCILSAPGAFGFQCSSHASVLKPLCPSLSHANFASDPRLTWKLAGCAWCDLCLPLDCFLFPATGFIVGLLCNLGSFSPVGQCSCLVVGLWILARILLSSL